MTTRFIRSMALTVAVFAFGGATSASAQSACRPADSLGTWLVNVVLDYTTGTDPQLVAARDSFRLPAVTAGKVTLVTEEETCRDAERAYRSGTRNLGDGFTGRVYLVRADTVHVVWDPGYAYVSSHPRRLLMVFDSRWRLLSMF